MGGESMSAEFTNIRNRNRDNPFLERASFDTMIFTDEGGFFSCGSAFGGGGDCGKRKIQGSFYGPEHAEAAGTVTWDGAFGFVGAFGAKRQ